MTDPLRFEGCDSEIVFRDVTTKARSDEARSLLDDTANQANPEQSANVRARLADATRQ